MTRRFVTMVMLLAAGIGFFALADAVTILTQPLLPLVWWMFP